ncbi:MAG: flavodoxin family protein [Peptococcaceae bacterium]|nr:flavodoxin family protein [Peptococcaceae bacterium]MDH7524563.1 flavodoxin family protein [Peptococcaceae bacterium]
MLIVGINGSPNKEGSTAFLLNKGLEQAARLGAKTEIIHAAEVLKDLAVPFCTVCSTPCQGTCMAGTSFEDALNLLSEADGMLVGSPVYFGSITGQLKAFWDQTRRLRAEKKLLNVAGGAVAVGASRFGGQELTIRVIQEMMLVQGMTIVGPGHAGHDCGHFGVAAQRPAQEDKQALERIAVLAKRIFEVARETRVLRE